MNKKTIETIFGKQDLAFNGKIEKIAVGFTNNVYDIDDAYILKVCGDAENEPFLKREAVLYDFFKNKLPVPKLIVFDESKVLLDSSYMIYPKIKGENLYNVWHRYTVDQRKDVVNQLCRILKVLNKTDVNDLPKASGIIPSSNWKKKVLSRINQYLDIAKDKQTLLNNDIEQVRRFIENNQHALDEQVMGLVYWDAHFDNVIVKNNQIVGLLDFERTDYESIDHVLDLVARMQRYPKKYMSEHAEQFAKSEDYQDLLKWYREFYPELFEFKNLSIRLNFYDLSRCLKDLADWPNAEQLKNDVRRASRT